MSQKNIILILLLVVALGAIAYFFGFKNFPTSTLSGKEPLPVSFPLKLGHKLYMEYDPSIVPTGKLFDLETSSGNLTQVETVDELSKITGTISTKEQALAFAEFFTSIPAMFLDQNPLSGIEPSHPYARERMPSSLSRLLTPAKVDKVSGQWVIERDLLMYPNQANQQQQTPAQLVRSRETISPTGTYTFSVSKVLAEGKEVNNLLPYYQ